MMDKDDDEEEVPGRWWSGFLRSTLPALSGLSVPGVPVPNIVDDTTLVSFPPAQSTLKLEALIDYNLIGTQMTLKEKQYVCFMQ